MTELDQLLDRLNKACSRIEDALAAPRPTVTQLAESEARYQALRRQTEAALVQLDAVIASVRGAA